MQSCSGPVVVRIRSICRRGVVPLQAGRGPDLVRQLPKGLARTDDFRIEIIGLLTLIEANTECMSGVQDRLRAGKWLPFKRSGVESCFGIGRYRAFERLGSTARAPASRAA